MPLWNFVVKMINFLIEIALSPRSQFSCVYSVYTVCVCLCRGLTPPCILHSTNEALFIPHFIQRLHNKSCTREMYWSTHISFEIVCDTSSHIFYCS